MNAQISVVICTFNRSALVAQVLETVCQQDASPSLYEIIVVDNNSTDDTQAVVSAFQANYPHLRYLLETELGLSHARNKGYREARGEYIAYIDDDCKVPAEYVTVAQAVIAEARPTIFGGPYFAFYNSPKPAWYKDSYNSKTISQSARPLQAQEFLTGMNVVFARSALEQSGGFRSDLGMKGNIVAYGEETALQMHIRQSIPNAIIYYEPKLYVYHLVRAEKMTWSRILRTSVAAGRYSQRIYRWQNPTLGRWERPVLRLLRALLLLVGDLLLGLVWRDRQQYPYVQNYWYEHTMQYVRAVGTNLEEIQAHLRAMR
jgi:glycosyltransferase involved in cell wall biosynthesis